MQACRSRIAKHELARDELVIEKAQAVIRHRDTVSQIRNAYLSLQDVQIRLIEAASDVRGLKERNGEIMQGLDEKKQEIRNFEDDATDARRDAEQAQVKVQQIVQDGGHEDLGRYQAMVADKSLDEIDQEIESEKAKLELIHAVDPSVLRQFEDRAKKIEELTKRTNDTEAKLGRLEDQIKGLMNKFEPRLEAIISKVNEAFGKNFERISCAGEVGLHKDMEDFDNWAIEIKVKFR